MMRITFFLLLCFVATNTQVSAQSYQKKAVETPLFKKLVLAKKNNGFAGVESVLQEMEKNADNINALSLFARDVYKTNPHEPRYGKLYADTLNAIMKIYELSGVQKESLMKTATMAFYSSQLTARENIARCEDRSAGQSYLMGWRSKRAKEMASFIQSLPKAEKDAHIKFILSFSAKRDLSKADREPCKDGIKYVQKAMDADKCVERSHAPINGKTPKGKNIVCDGSDFVEFIDEAKWNEKRKAIQKSMAKFLAGEKEGS